ncbi:MAG: GHKL domain-containing protein [Clostridia bacterium]|nr:GHKL domain-containing protein [Clostridia bacterium]
MEPTVWNHILGLSLYSLFFIPVAVLLYELTRRLLSRPHVPGQMLPFVVFTLLSWCTNRLVLLYANGLNLIFSILWHVVILWVVFRQRGWQLVLGLLKLIIQMVLMELVCALVLLVMDGFRLDTSQMMVVGFADLFNPLKLLLTALLNILGMMPILVGLLLWERWQKHRTLPKETRRRQWLFARSILRLVILLVATLSVFSMPHFLFGSDSLRLFTIPSKGKYIALIVTVVLMLGVAISYAAQDIRYIMQSQRLNTLEQQQAISNSLLQNLRYFRHNMVNMLYGLEGELISGDRKTITAYYQQMREKCMLVNNENIAALERVTNPSVGAVLLRGVDKARQMNLPMNLYVQQKVFFGRTLPDMDLCQVLGVMQDNAIEAADKAEERYVSVEIRNVENGVEIIVKNTYAGEVSPENLTRGGVSTKEGHEGQGLRSCYEILSRRRGAFLNFWVTGQYVQAQLLLTR